MRTPHTPTLLICALLLTAGCGTGGGAETDADAGVDPVEDAGTDDAGSDETGTVITPRYEPDGEGFYRIPWPSDDRLDEDGLVDLGDFPGAGGLIIRVFRTELEKIAGFSVAPVLYVNLDAAPPNSRMPTPVETVRPEGAVQLVALGDACGDRLPLSVDVDTLGDRYIDPNTLRITPEPGFLLDSGRAYALVLRKDFASDVTLARPEGFAAALETETFAPMRDCFDELEDIDLDDVAVATVFTTQDTTSVMRAMREVVLDEVEAPVVTDWRLTPDPISDAYTLYDGAIEVPIFQKGASPYRAPGTGGIELDASGKPVIQRTERVPFSVAMPNELPDGPLPVMLFEDGTWAAHFEHLNNEVVRQAIDDGFVVVNFVPQFHSPRADYDDDDIVSLTFNYLNPAAGRSVFRQQAAETIYVSRLIREVLPGLEGMPELDTERLVYGGHSQGSLVGGIVAGVSDEFAAYGMNGLGAYTATTIVYRKDYLDVEKTLRDAAQVGRPMDIKHPVVHLAQLGTDVIDPMAYAPYWAGTPGANSGAHIFVTNGGRDTTSSPVGITAFTLAAGLDIIEEAAAWTLDPYRLSRSEGVSVPFTANREGTSGQPLTQATYLVEAQGHFTLYRLPRAANFMRSFWRSAADGTPIIRD